MFNVKETKNIAENFFNQVKKNPDKIALIHRNRKITYAQLSDAINTTAENYRKKGIKKGDRILVFVPMSISLYVSVLAIFNIGATAVFLDEWVNKKRLHACCRIANCNGFVISKKFKLVARFSNELRRIPIWLKPWIRGKGIASKQEEINFDDTALITFTTGNTGVPKAANRTHAFLHAQFKALIDKIEPDENDIGMPVLPIVLLLNLGAGCTSLIVNQKATKPYKTNFNLIGTQILHFGITRIESSPDFLKRLSLHVLKYKLPVNSVTKIFTGGAPVFPIEAEIYKNAFPNAKIEVVYGSTEAEPISAIAINELIPFKEKISDGLPVGKIYSGTSVKIIPFINENLVIKTQDELDNITCARGTLGEIIVSGAHVLISYFNNEEALMRNKIFIGDTCWHRTGDSGFINEKNELFLTGRCENLIPYHNQLLAPFIYENAIRETELTPIGTLLKINEKLIVVAEGNEAISAELKQKLIDKNLVFDEIKMMENIPRDPRHHSKIEYGRLRV